MKKTFIIISVALCCSLGISANKKLHESLVIPYDSMANFVGKNVEAYKGQEFYLKGLEKRSREYGYTGFILDYKKDDDLLNDEKNIYKPNANYNSKYDDLVGKYFNVLDVIRHPKAGQGNYSDIFYLKLQELSGGDVLYYKYNTNSEFTFPFIVRGFLEKQKLLFAGKKFIISDNLLKISRNIATGSALKFTTGEEWKCLDVTMDNIANEISFLLQNKYGLKTTIPYSNLSKPEDGIKKMYTQEEANAYIKKFNTNNFRRILQNKIREGMTKEMSRLAWGEPQEIKETGKNEEWIYSTGSLTFSGDKIIKSK